MSFSYQVANYSSLDQERMVFSSSMFSLIWGFLSPLEFVFNLDICNHIWMAP